MIGLSREASIILDLAHHLRQAVRAGDQINAARFAALINELEWAYPTAKDELDEMYPRAIAERKGHE